MALGKGLGSLIPSQPQNQSTQHVPAKHTPSELQHQAQASQFAAHSQDAVVQIPLNTIQPNPHQPRMHFAANELEDLVQSIKQHGVLQPVLVSQAGNGYELIAGERRFRASKLAGLKTVPAIVRDPSELEKVELALIENIQRSDLNAMEKAESYRKLAQEFGLNHDEAAKKLGVSRSAFSNALRLLDLPGEIQQAVAAGKVSEGHAKIIVGLPTVGAQLRAMRLVIEEGVSVHKLHELMQGKTKQARGASAPATGQLKPPHIVALEQELMQTLATKVHIQPKGEGGKIEIDYYAAEELSDLVRKLNKR